MGEKAIWLGNAQVCGRKIQHKSASIKRFCVCTILIPKPMTMGISLGTTLLACMRTTLENGILHNRQQPGSAVNSFFDHSKFEAMKSLSGCEAVRCSEHQSPR